MARAAFGSVQTDPYPEDDTSAMGEYIDASLRERRSLEQAVADLLAKYEKHPSVELVRMIRQLEAEIAERKRRP